MAKAKKSQTQQNPLAALARGLLDFRERREEVKRVTELNKETQPHLIAEMQEVGVGDDGIVIDPNDKKGGAAYVQQNQPSEFWDEEKVWEYVRRRKVLKRAVTSSVLDMRKWEAEVANGNVPAKVAKKMKTKGDAPAPFIRFGKLDPKNHA